MLRRRSGPPRSPLGAAHRTSHRGALAATVLLLSAWACATMGAPRLAPLLGQQAAAVERALGLDAAIPEEED